MINNKSKQEHWLRHLQAGEQYRRGIAAYCQDNGLPISSYHYWKRKLSRRDTALTVVEPSFIPVALTRADSNLPDAAWVARFVTEFVRGFQ